MPEGARPRSLLVVVLVLCAAVLGFAAPAHAQGTDPSEISVSTNGQGPVGEPAPVSARVTGDGPTPTGTVTFVVYGPWDEWCEGERVSEDTVELTTSQDDPSSAEASTTFVPTGEGWHQVVATYNGDERFAQAYRECGSDGFYAYPKEDPVGVSVTENVFLGAPADAYAYVRGETDAVPTGQLTFRYFEPGDTQCATPVFEETKTLTPHPESPDAAEAGSDGFRPATEGFHELVVSYGGDAENPPFATACGADTFRAYPGPEATLSPTGLAFASVASPQPIGTMGPIQYVTVTNTGDEVTVPSEDGDSGEAWLEINGVAVSNPDEFMIAANTCAASGDSDGMYLARGQSCEIGVRFTPQGSGERTGELRVRSNDPASPATAALTGYGGAQSGAISAGAAGPDGTDGTDGADGAEGADGAPGAKGATGATGATGTAGANGTNGTSGTNGLAGLIGPMGPAGPLGLTGPAGPAGTLVLNPVGLLCSEASRSCRVTLRLARGTRLVTGALVKSTGSRHLARSRSGKGVLLNRRGRAIRLGSGTYVLRIRVTGGNGRSVTRIYALTVAA